MTTNLLKRIEQHTGQPAAIFQPPVKTLPTTPEFRRQFNKLTFPLPKDPHLRTCQLTDFCCRNYTQRLIRNQETQLVTGFEDALEISCDFCSQRPDDQKSPEELARQ